jgi:GDP-L-fucose synthase
MSSINRDIAMGNEIYVAGHLGMVGSALMRRLSNCKDAKMVVRTRNELDLRDRAAVEEFFAAERPDQVYLAAAKVGGIVANAKYPADFMRDNLQIQTNVIDAAWRHGCKKLLFLGSSCIFPKLCPQPIKEEYLLTGPLEDTNEGFALAKIAGILMCRTYRRQFGFNAIAIMPANLYGPGDHFHPENSHVLAALLRRFHEAKSLRADKVVVWGTGTPKREFLHVDDLADACVFLMETYNGAAPVNIGSGVEFSIIELARRVAAVVGFTGEIVMDAGKPDGTPRKFLDSSAIRNLGWKAKMDFTNGLKAVYDDFCERLYTGNIRI